MNYIETNNQTATYGEKSQSVLALQKQLNTLGANIAEDSMFGPQTQSAYDKYIVSNNNSPNIETPTPIEDIAPSSSPTLPEQEAENIYTTAMSSLEASANGARSNLEETYKIKKEELAKKEEFLKQEQSDILKMMDPEKRDTYQQETKIKQDELDAAETAAATLEEDFLKRRKLTDELEVLLAQGNSLLKREKGLALNQRVLNSRTSRTMSDISARAGIIQSVFSAIDGNISQAYNIINQAKNTVAAHWNDNLNYYSTLLNLNQNNLIKLDIENKDIAEKEVSLIESDLNKLDATSNYIKSLMIDPETAQYIADAGISLNDSIETINEKMSKQSQVEEIKNVKNEMSKDGYDYVPFPSSTAGLIPIQAGDKTLYFKSKPDKKTTKSKTKNTTDDKYTKNMLSLKNKTVLLRANMTLDEIDILQSNVNDFGLDKVLSEQDDENIISAIKDAYGFEKEEMSTDETDPEMYMRENLTEKELKKLSDLANTSKWWRRKSKDINAFFSSQNEELLKQIQLAIKEGYNIDDIISFLDEE